MTRPVAEIRAEIERIDKRLKRVDPPWDTGAALERVMMAVRRDALAWALREMPAPTNKEAKR